MRPPANQPANQMDDLELLQTLVYLAGLKHRLRPPGERDHAWSSGAAVAPAPEARPVLDLRRHSSTDA